MSLSLRNMKKKKLTSEYAFNFWHGDPLYPDTYYFNHTSKIRDFDTTSRQDLHYEYLNNSAGITYGDISIINDVFSKIEFNSEYLNRYYKKPNEIPKEGFPSSEDTDDHTIVGSNDLDDILENVDSDNADYPKPRFVVDYDYVYEIDEKGNEIFPTSHYVEIQMFYSSLKNLFANLAEQFSNKKIMSKFDELCFSGKLNDLIYDYAYIFLDDVKNKVNHKKLQKLFIKELNFYFSDFYISLRDCDLNNYVWPGETDRDYEPNVHSQFQFFVDYKGIKNRRKF